MKLTALLLTVAILQVHASGSAQSVTIAGKDIPLKNVFTAIKQQTGYGVFYNKDILGNTKPVTLSAYNMPLQEFLQLLFRDQPVTFTIQEKTIILSQQETTKPPVIERLIFEAPSVKGRIIDADEQAITNVSIRIRGTNKGTTSGAGGFFSIELKDGEVIDISAVGFSPIALRLNGEQFQAVPVERSAARSQQSNSKEASPGSQLLITNMQSVLIKLIRSNAQMDEVVIIPYGQTSKRLTTGNVVSIKAKDIERQPVMNIMHALEGKVPGMTITSLSGNSAAPVKVEIRGRSSLNAAAIVEPLYIINGVPLTTLEIGPYTKMGEVSTGAVQSGRTNTPGESPLLFLNPRDIESIEILKDADATAIYGSRGANGVILITTKKAKSGPSSFNLTINNGILTLPRRMDLLSTPEYLAVRREAYRNEGITPDKYSAPDLTIWDSTRYTDWQRELIGTGNAFSLSAGLSGGMAQTSYSLRAFYNSRKEIMNNGGKSITGGLSLALNHSSPNQKLRVTVSSMIVLTDVNAYFLRDVMFMPPNAPAIYDENGDFNWEPWRERTQSAFKFAGLKTPSESKTTVVNTAVNISYELLRGLTISANMGYNMNQNNNAIYLPLASYDPAFPRMAQASFGNSSNNGWFIEPQLQYITLIGKGNLSILAGSNATRALTRSLTTLAMGFPNDNLIRSINNAAFRENTDAMQEYKQHGVYGIINFRWDNKYVINLSARRDGSSRFGPGRQFGDFGSVGLAWIASDEKWMQKILPAWINVIKLRGSYGITGMEGGQDYGYITRWGTSYDLFANQRLYEYNGSQVFHIARSINPEYGWSSAAKLDLGTSLSLFKDRLTIEASWYRNRIGNQLTGVNTPEYTGFPSVLANWPAVVQNSGIELQVSGSVLQTQNWSVRLSANFSRNQNKLVEYPGFEHSPDASSYVLGKSLSTGYLLHYTGIDPLTGNYTFEDRNKDGQITTIPGKIPRNEADDRYIEFDPVPKFQGGFGATANYKDFSLIVGFVYKKQKAEDPFLLLDVGGMNNLVLPDEIKNNHWQQPGDNALYPKYTIAGSLGPMVRQSDAAMIDASYIRLNTLSIMYQLPAKWLKKIGMKGCAFSADTQNLFVISSYKGIDPDIRNLTGFTPQSRAITTTLTFNF